MLNNLNAETIKQSQEGDNKEYINSTTSNPNNETDIKEDPSKNLSNKKDLKISKTKKTITEKNLFLNLNEYNSSKVDNDYLNSLTSNYNNENNNNDINQTLGHKKSILTSEKFLEMNKTEPKEFEFEYNKAKGIKNLASPKNITVNNILSGKNSSKRNKENLHDSVNIKKEEAEEEYVNFINADIKEKKLNIGIDNENNNIRNFRFDSKKEIFSENQINIHDEISPYFKQNYKADFSLKQNLIGISANINLNSITNKNYFTSNHEKDTGVSQQVDKNSLYLSNEFIINSLKLEDSKHKKHKTEIFENLNNNYFDNEDKIKTNFNQFQIKNTNDCENLNDNISYNIEVIKDQNIDEENEINTKNRKIKRRNKSTKNNNIFKSSDFDFRYKNKIIAKENGDCESNFFRDENKNKNEDKQLQKNLNKEKNSHDKKNIFNNSILKKNSFGKQNTLSFSKPSFFNESELLNNNNNNNNKINQSNSLINLNSIDESREKSNSFIEMNDNKNFNNKSNNINNNNQAGKVIKQRSKSLKKKSSILNKNKFNLSSSINQENPLANDLTEEKKNTNESSNKIFNFTNNIDTVNNNNNNQNTNIKDENQTSIAYKTSQSSLKDIYRILSKRKFDRSKSELNYLIKFLSTNFSFFRNLSNQKDYNTHIKLDACAAALNIRFLSENEIVFNCGEAANSFFIVLHGRVRVIKPKMHEKEMSFKSFIEYLHKIKFTEKDEVKLDRVQQANLKSINLNHIKRYNYEVSKFANDNHTKKFVIEEPNTVAFIKEGGEFGETALMFDCKRTATIQADCGKCVVAFIERNEFNKAYYEMEEKDFTAKILEFKNAHWAFRELRRGLVYRLLNAAETVDLFVGEVVCEQNSEADCFWVSLDGCFEVSCCVSLQSYRGFLEYVGSQKNSLLNAMVKQKVLKECEFEEMRRNSDKIYGLPSNSFSRDNHILDLEARTKTQNPLDIKMKEEVLKNTNYPIQVTVKTLDKPDIIGLEEALELKRRFYTVKCTSTTGTLYKIDLKTLFNLINKEEVPKNTFIEFIMERKKRLFAQVQRSILLKHKTLDKQLSHNYTSIFTRMEKTENSEKLNHSKIEILHEEVTSNKDLIEYFKSESKNKKNFSSNEFLSNDNEELDKEQQMHQRCFSSNYAKINLRNKNFVNSNAKENRFNKKVNKILANRDIKSANPFASAAEAGKKKEIYLHKQNQCDLSNDKGLHSFNNSNFSVNKSFNEINRIKNNVKVDDYWNKNIKNAEQLKIKETDNKVISKVINNNSNNQINNANSLNKLNKNNFNTSLKSYNQNLACVHKNQNAQNICIDESGEFKQNNSYIGEALNSCNNNKNKEAWNNNNPNSSVILDNSCIYNKKTEILNKLNNHKSITNSNNNNINKINKQNNPVNNKSNNINNENLKTERTASNFNSLKNSINQGKKNPLTNRLVSSQSRISVFSKNRIKNENEKFNINDNNNNNNINSMLDEKILKNKISLTKNNINKIRKQSSQRSSGIITNNNTNDNNNNPNNISKTNIKINLQNKQNNINNYIKKDAKSKKSSSNKKFRKSKSLKKLRINEKTLLNDKEQIFSLGSSTNVEKEILKEKIEDQNLNQDLKTFHPELFYKSQSAKLNLVNFNQQGEIEEKEANSFLANNNNNNNQDYMINYFNNNKNNVSGYNFENDNDPNLSSSKNVIHPLYNRFNCNSDDHFKRYDLKVGQETAVGCEVRNFASNNELDQSGKSPRNFIYNYNSNAAVQLQNKHSTKGYCETSNTLKINYFDFNIDKSDIKKNSDYKSIGNNPSFDNLTHSKSPKENNNNNTYKNLKIISSGISNKPENKNNKSPKMLICQSDNEVVLGSHVDLFNDLNKQIDNQFNPANENTRITFNFSGFCHKNKGESNFGHKSAKNKKIFNNFNFFKTAKSRSKNLIFSRRNKNFFSSNNNKNKIENNFAKKNENNQLNCENEDFNLDTERRKSVSYNFKTVSPKRNLSGVNKKNSNENFKSFNSTKIPKLEKLISLNINNNNNKKTDFNMNMHYSAKLGILSNRSNKSPVDWPEENQAKECENELKKEENQLQMEQGKINENEENNLNSSSIKEKKAEKLSQLEIETNNYQEENFNVNDNKQKIEQDQKSINAELIYYIPQKEKDKDDKEGKPENVNVEEISSPVATTEGVKYVNTNEKPFIPLFQFDSQKYSEKIKKKSFSEIRQEITKLTGVQLHPKENIYTKKIYSEQYTNQLMKINPYINEEFNLLEENSKSYSNQNLKLNKNSSLNNSDSKNKDFDLNRSRNVSDNSVSINANKNNSRSRSRSRGKTEAPKAPLFGTEKAHIYGSYCDASEKSIEDLKSVVVFNKQSTLNFKSYKDKQQHSLNNNNNNKSNNNFRKFNNNKVNKMNNVNCNSNKSHSHSQNHNSKVINEEESVIYQITSNNNTNNQKTLFYERNVENKNNNNNINYYKDLKNNEFSKNNNKKLINANQNANKKRLLSSFEQDLEKISKTKSKNTKQKNPLLNFEKDFLTNEHKQNKQIIQSSGVKESVKNKKTAKTHSSEAFRSLAENFNKKLNNNDSIVMAEKIEKGNFDFIAENSGAVNAADKSEFFGCEQQSFTNAKFFAPRKNSALLFSENKNAAKSAARALSKYAVRTQKISLDANSSLKNFMKNNLANKNNYNKNIDKNNDDKNFNSLDANYKIDNNNKNNYNSNLNLNKSLKKDLVKSDSTRVILSGIGGNKVNYSDKAEEKINSKNAFCVQNVNSDASENNENEYVNRFFQNSNTKFADRRKTKISVKVQMKYFKMLKKDK